MLLLTSALVALGALAGAPLRFALGTHLDAAVPWGTLAVNVAGSFLLGLFSALALDEQLLALLGTGFCGALTTYSSFAVQSHRLGPRVGSAYAAGTIAASLGACFLGFWLGA